MAFERKVLCQISLCADCTGRFEKSETKPDAAQPKEQFVAKSAPVEKQSTSSTASVTQNNDEEAKKNAAEKAKRTQEFAAKQKAELDALMAKANDIKAMIFKSLFTVSPLIGDVSMACPSDAKVVRIFTSSTFTDTKQERNYLMKHAYPKIKSHCRALGYEFQVVDMRWGLRDEAADDHMTTELCLKELKLCQELSTGPNFVTLLSHKYGYNSFPRVIKASEFEELMTEVKDEHTLALFQKWYTRDDNAIPPEYVLSPISKHLPAFIGKQGDEKKLAKQTWWNESESMQSALEQSSAKLYDEQHTRKFIMSVSESEIKEGLLDVKQTANQCLWLKRDIVDIDKQEKNYALSRFMECTGPEEKYTKAQTLLKELKEHKMEKKLKENQILQYNVHWDAKGGINPETSEEHKTYLNKLSEDFTSSMTGMIDKAVKAKSGKDDPLINECIQHIRFCQQKCKNFHGREETLEKIKTYVTSTKVNKSPLVIHGESGSGKTSIMAMVAKSIEKWVKPKPLILLRFLGTTEASSSLMELLYSMTSQLQRCLKVKVTPPTENIKVQTNLFWLAVHKYKAKNPLVIIMDSLDQLNDSYDARKLQWIMPLLAKGTFIFSTLEEPQYHCFPALQQIVQDPANFVSVPTLSRESSSQILSSWFDMNKRQVTTKQMNILLNAFDKCSTPLFLKLSFDEAIRWTSYIGEDEMVLCDTVRASIDHLFERLEKHHGKILLSRALAYLTISCNGASEVELEDILSCDDDVLNDVYQYWTPPTRRLPPLLMVRIRTDLSQYLVERGADGVRVLYWYHRQFIEAAEARYCRKPETVQIIHRNLADFFTGVWANGKKKPYTDSEGVTMEEDRFVSAQPLTFGAGKYNLRRLNNFPYHCIKGGNVDMLMKQYMVNIEFIRTKLNAVHFISVIDDFKMANKAFPDEPLIEAILGALQLSQKGLKTDPRQLVPQMLQRLTVKPETSDFLQQCRSHKETFLEPNMPLLDLPGGQLVHTIATHQGDVDMIDITTDGKVALTVCQEKNEVFLWYVEEAKQLRAVQAPGQCTETYFCMNNQRIALETSKTKEARVEDVQTGSKKLYIPMFKVCWCVAGVNKDTLVVFKARSCNIHSLENNGELVGTADLAEGEKKFGQLSVRAGSDNFVAVTDENQYFISVLDLRNKQFLKQFRGFPKVKDEDGDWEEHEVEAMCITPDETGLIYTTMFTSEVVFSDFIGTKLRSIPGDKDRTYTSLELSPDGAQIFLCSDNNVHIFSSNTLQEVDMINHLKNVKKARVVKEDCMVTMCDDSNLRIWDRSRDKLTTSHKSTFLKQTSMKTVYLLANPRYLFTAGRLEVSDKHMTIAVYDIFKEKTVKIFKIECTDKDKSIVNVNLSHVPGTMTKVHLIYERKLYIIDLNTMTIEMTTDGHLNRRFWGCLNGVHYSANNEIVCLTKGSRNLKLYDQSTGKVTKVIKAAQQKQIGSLTVSKSGTRACAMTEDEILLVFDLSNYKHLYNIDDKVLYKDAGYQMLINREGTILMFSVSMPLAEFKDKRDVDQIIIWDIENRKELGRMLDLEYEKKYRQMNKPDLVGNTAVSDIFELDADRALTIGFDDIIRIHDIRTGKLLHRLEGHFSTPDVYIEDKCPYLLTLASTDEEGCLRLWDKETYQCLASFTLEKDIYKISISPDGRFFTAILTENSKEFLVQWRIHHSPFDCTVNVTDYPEGAFSSTVEGESMFLDKTKTPVQQDPDDVDSDPDVESGDEEEEDDDVDEEGGLG